MKNLELNLLEEDLVKTSKWPWAREKILRYATSSVACQIALGRFESIEDCLLKKSLLIQLVKSEHIIELYFLVPNKVEFLKFINDLKLLTLSWAILDLCTSFHNPPSLSG